MKTRHSQNSKQVNKARDSSWHIVGPQKCWVLDLTRIFLMFLTLTECPLQNSQVFHFQLTVIPLWTWYSSYSRHNLPRFQVLRADSSFPVSSFSPFFPWVLVCRSCLLLLASFPSAALGVAHGLLITYAALSSAFLQPVFLGVHWCTVCVSRCCCC